MHDRRRNGTRLSREILVRLYLFDSTHLRSEPCLIIVVNLEGCGVRFSHPLEIGTRVHLEGLPEKRSVTARVVNCISLGDYEKFWFLGLALDEPGNVWGIKTPPEDWHTYPPLARR
jgi:hypothetical protein